MHGSPASQVALSALAAINPPRAAHGLHLDSKVSFIAMPDVSDSGDWLAPQTRRLRELAAGYTAFAEGDVLFAKITPCMENGKGLHAVGLENGIGFGSTEFHVLRARAGSCSRFIYHWTRSRALRQKAKAAMIGSAGQQRVPETFFDEFRVRAFSTEEQRRIAEILDTIDEAIRRTEQVIAKLQQMKQGLLHDLLTRGIDENGDVRDPDGRPETFKNSPIGQVPSEWEVIPIEEVTESSVDGPFGSNLKTEHYVDRPGVRLVRLQNIGVGEFLDAEKSWITESHARTLARHEVQPGDVLIASLGDPTHPFARSCVYPQEHSPGIVKADCFRFRLTNRVVSGFVAHIFNAPHWRRGWLGLARRSGVSRDRINLSALRQLRIPIPPRAEQHRIADRLLAHERRIELEASTKDKLRALKHALLDDLLTGRVRMSSKEGALA